MLVVKMIVFADNCVVISLVDYLDNVATVVVDLRALFG